MVYFLVIVGAINWLIGGAELVASKSTLQETSSLLWVVSGSVLIGAGCIIAAIRPKKPNPYDQPGPYEKPPA